MIWTLGQFLCVRLLQDWSSCWISLFSVSFPLYLSFPSFLSCFAFSPFAAWWVFPSTALLLPLMLFIFSPSLPHISDHAHPLNPLPSRCSVLLSFSLVWFVTSCSSGFFLSSFIPLPSPSPTSPTRAFSKSPCLVLFHAKRLFLSSLTKPRLSSLTIGDSERKSSATQQREPTVDFPAESTGNYNFPRWFML